MSLPRPIVTALLALSFWVSSAAVAQQVPNRITVYKTVGCSCCIKWVEHLRAAGFQVEAIDSKNLDAQRERLACRPSWRAVTPPRSPATPSRATCRPGRSSGCSNNTRMSTGLAVPGMPVGSPGMEGPGGQDYYVLVFDREGNSKVFATVKPLDH